MECENQSFSDLKCGTRHRGYPGKGIKEGDCIRLSLRTGIMRALNESVGNFKGHHTAQTKQLR